MGVLFSSSAHPTDRPTSGTRGVVAALLVASVAAVRLSVAEEEAGDAAAVGDALQKINERTSKKTCPLQKKQHLLKLGH